MTVQEAFALIKGVTPCWDCKYKTSSCNRDVAHVWADGFCHDFDEAIEILTSFIPVEEASDPEPEPTIEPNPDSEPEP